MTNYLIILSFLGLGFLFPYDASQSTQQADAPAGNGNEVEMVHQLVHQELVDQIRERSPFDDMDLNMMSRCPSGIQADIQSIPEYAHTENSWYEISKTEYYYGEVNRYNGCNADLLCEYRVLAAEQLVEVLANDQESYVAVGEWLDAHYPKRLDDMLSESVQVAED